MDTTQAATDEPSLPRSASSSVCILGPAGVRTTFVASALGHLAVGYDYNVIFTRVDELLRQLTLSRFDLSRDAEMIALTTIDFLIWKLLT